MAKKTKKKTFDEIFIHYFICESCATKMGGILGKGCYTVHIDTCEYCKEKATLFAVRDFSYPKYRKREVWD